VSRRVLNALLVLVGFLQFSTFANSSEVMDKIVAVVGNYAILESEVDFQLQLWLMQQQNRNQTSDELEQVRRELIDQMVNDKLILTKAIRDTSISVSSEQIEEALNQKLDELKNRFPSQAEFERQMQAEGLTYRELKTKFRDEMRNQLYKDKLISRELSKISVSQSEIRKFYEEYKDSLPPHPDAVKLAHILLGVKASQATLDSALAKARIVKGLLAQGLDFAELARIYSDGPTAASGGDLGYFEKGDLVAEFEKAAFALDSGDVSDIVRTEYGYHIIKCEGRQGDRIHCRHILCMVEPTDEDMAAVLALADSLIERIKQGEDFAELVKEYSIDENTKIQGGELGWFVYDDMTPEFKVAVAGLNQGELSSPTRSQLGIHILKVLDRQVARPWSLDDDWDRLKNLAKREKTESVVTKLIGELKQETYVDMRY